MSARSRQLQRLVAAGDLVVDFDDRLDVGMDDVAAERAEITACCELGLF